ncbi:hypothetical protein ES17_3 [Escherichia phage ES17]|uniref:Uncharacterized protein n=1 Tax=Escherichia phage ES17 TaxID=2662277 RepID=A0A7T0Q1A7_9CAUD|nr:hypothetical protein PQC45_gp003 [Escherichia phage ES17]QPL11048.1 hypothetical protein ES17_3 [Escherichia phage ES17]
MNTGTLTGVNVMWPLRVDLMMCPLYFYSEDKNMRFLKELHSLIYKDIVYSVSRNAWFYQKGGNGEWVD